MSRTTSNRAFTLIEVLVSCFLFTLFVGMIGEAMVMGYRAHQHTEATVKTMREVTASLDLMRQDIESCPLTGATPAVTLAAQSLTTPLVLTRNTNPSDSGGTTGVTYALTPDPRDPTLYQLTRTVALTGQVRTLDHGIVSMTYQQSPIDVTLCQITIKVKSLPSAITIQAGWAP